MFLLYFPGGIYLHIKMLSGRPFLQLLLDVLPRVLLLADILPHLLGPRILCMFSVVALFGGLMWDLLSL